MDDNPWWKTNFDGRWPSMEGKLLWKTSLDERLPWIKDNLWWKKTFYGTRLLMEDNLWWKMTLDGRHPGTEDDLGRKTTLNGMDFRMEGFTCHFTQLNYWSYFEEPLRLYGKGDYALTDVKEMTGTEDFFNLDVEVRKCQNRESLLECQAKKYKEIGKKECQCVPYQLRSFFIKVSHVFGQSTACALLSHFFCPSVCLCVCLCVCLS